MDQSPPPVPPQQPAPSALPPGGKARFSQCAIWSLVLGILSFAIWIFGSIPAIILGAIGVKNVNADPANLKGKGMAVAGIIFGSIGIVVGGILFLAALSFPAYHGIQERGRQIKDIGQIRQLTLACRIYASENEGQYPATLEQLVPDYLEDPANLSVSESVNAQPQPYLYRPGLNDSSDPDEPLILSPIAYKRGSTPVGYAGGQVNSARGEELEEIRAKFTNQ